MTATALWAYVKTVYDADGLASLTNIRSPEATALVDATGEAAAQSVINLWPAYAQVDYDSSDALHLEVAAVGVIAMLWRRGGKSTEVEQVKWDTVFGDGGMIEKVRRTDPRGRRIPKSNSGTITSQESGNRYGWADRASLPPGFLPSTIDTGSED